MYRGSDLLKYPLNEVYIRKNHNYNHIILLLHDCSNKVYFITSDFFPFLLPVKVMISPGW